MNPNLAASPSHQQHFLQLTPRVTGAKLLSINLTWFLMIAHSTPASQMIASGCGKEFSNRPAAVGKRHWAGPVIKLLGGVGAESGMDGGMEVRQ